MKLWGLVVAALAAPLLTACGTIVEGTHQDIAISSTPDGAHCDAIRKGQKLGSVDSTPGKMTVRKTKDDILLKCTKVGYQESSQYLHSGMAAGTFGNIIAGGLIGWGVDSATGADNKYPESVNVQLIPAGGTAPSAPSTVRNSLLPNS